MRFAPPLRHPSRRPPRRENIVPMINVVFLLLIFFLMSARIAPPDPFATEPPPAAGGEAAPGPATLFVSAEGELAFGAARGRAAVLAAIAADGAGPDAPLLIRADGRAPARLIAGLLSDLARSGRTSLALTVGTVR